MFAFNTTSGRPDSNVGQAMPDAGGEGSAVVKQPSKRAHVGDWIYTYGKRCQAQPDLQVF